MTTTTTTPASPPPNATLPFANQMHPEITLEQALGLVEYVYVDGHWQVLHVGGNVGGMVYGSVGGNVYGSVGGNVRGNVGGNVRGNVGGTINGRRWQLIETPFEKLKRLIESDAPKGQVLEALTEIESQAQS